MDVLRDHGELYEIIDDDINSDDVGVIPTVPHPLARYRPPIPQIPKAEDMLIEGILCARVSFIGAYAGAGKTTAMVPLVALVAGLMDVEGLNIPGWRNVVYLSEHPEQFEESLKALAEEHGICLDLITERIKVVTTKRMEAEDIVKAVPEFRSLRVNHTQNGVTVPFDPWIVVDTQAATLQLESENDNTEASKAMAILKDGFSGVPLTLISHTAKAHKNGEADTMTIRGAGAFEADCTQVLYLICNDKTGKRFINIAKAKHRFNATYDALALEYHTTYLCMHDRFGREIERKVGYCTLKPVTNEDKAKDDTAAQSLLERSQKKQVLIAAGDLLNQLNNDKKPMTRNALATELAERKIPGLGNKQRLTGVIRKLVEDGNLVEQEITPEIKAQLQLEGWTVHGRHINQIVGVKALSEVESAEP